MGGEKVGSQFKVYNLRNDLDTRAKVLKRMWHACHDLVNKNEKGAASPRVAEKSSRPRGHRGSSSLDLAILSLQQSTSQMLVSHKLSGGNGK